MQLSIASVRGGGDAEAYREIYLNGARHLLETFPKARVLFTSSTSVYAQRDGSRVTEESETKPLRETSRILLEVEKLILEKGGTIARLAGIYGPRRSALLSKFLNGTATIDPNNDRFVNQSTSGRHRVRALSFVKPRSTDVRTDLQRR